MPISVGMSTAPSRLAPAPAFAGRRAEDVLESAPDPLLVVDGEGILVWANPAAERLFGVALEDAVGTPGLDLVHPDDLEFAVLSLLSVREKVVGSPIEVRLLAHDGWRLIELVGAPMPGSVRGEVVLSLRDLTDRRRFEVAADDDARFRSLVHNSTTLTMLVCASGELTAASGALARLLGHDPGVAVGQPFVELVDPDDRDSVTAALAEATAAPAGAAGALSVEARLIRNDGGPPVPFELTIVNLVDDPTVAGLVVSGHDLTERMRLEQQLAHQALHDSLTGLANQSLFRDRVEHALTRVGRHGGRLAVLFLDLDDFKSVNDSLGHPAGDQLLVEVSRRVEQAIRATDTAARLGGDEFAVLLEDVGDDTEIVDVAERLLRAVRQTVTLDGTEVSTSVSIGVALADPSMSCDQLLRDADLAMYTAKRRGRGRFELYRQEMHAAAVERLTLETELRHALERDELVVHYQPIIDLATGGVWGVEALVRWHHPIRGVLGPAAFIRAAEETGLIDELSRLVLSRACAQAGAWRRAAPHLQDLSISVNLPAGLLHDPGLAQVVHEVLAEHELDADALILEITEGAMMHETEEVIANLVRLKAVGVRVAVDDFGTGYSSLAYLQRFPIDILKVDKCFVDGLGRTSADAELAQAIIRLAHALHLTPIAEGIERADQRERLRDLGCDLAQGYLFGRPANATAVTARLLQA